MTTAPLTRIDGDGAAAATGPLVEATGLEVTIRDERILVHAELALEAGQVVAIVGPNGAGKSTLARAIVGLQPISAGRVEWEGRALGDWSGRELARTRAFVPQRAPVSTGLTVADAVAMGRAPHLGPLRRPSTRDRAAVDRAIVRTGVSHLVDRSLATLSGGELQRVRLAVAVAQEAAVIVLDEPTASLDLGAAAEMGRLLRDLAAEGLGILVVVHDLALAAAIADAVVVVDAGRTVASGAPSEVLTRGRLAQTWGAAAALELEGGATSFHVDWLHSGRTPAAIGAGLRLHTPEGAPR